MILADVQKMAWRVMALPAPKLNAPVTTSAIYKYWDAHKDVGPPVTNELALSDGTTALITATGRVLHWLGGDDVEVL